jgi:hypothetical protein
MKRKICVVLSLEKFRFHELYFHIHMLKLTNTRLKLYSFEILSVLCSDNLQDIHSQK